MAGGEASAQSSLDLMRTIHGRRSHLLAWIISIGALPLICGITSCSTGRPSTETAVNSDEFSSLASPTGREGLVQSAPASSSDTAIGQQIYHMLIAERSLAPGPNQVTASVRDGVVTLTGQVPRSKNKEQLRSAISAIPGVQRVDDSGLGIGLGRLPGSHETNLRTEPAGP